MTRLLRTRRAVAGPERDLVAAALRSLSRRLSAPLLFREPELPTGFPDIVAVVFGSRTVPATPARFRLGREHLRLLHHVYTVRRACAPDLAATLGWRSVRCLQATLDDLERARLVRQARGRVMSMSLASVFPAKRIVAVEAKIHDWRRALQQAVANTWFASHSYVLMPAGRWHAALRQDAGRLGIGVMIYDGKRTVVRLRARRHRIPASYGSWLVNEWAVRAAGPST